MTAATGTATGQSNVTAGGGYAPASTGRAEGSSVVAASSTVIEVYDSQQALLSVVEAERAVRASQVMWQVLGTSRADLTMQDQMALLTLTQITAEEELTSQMPLLAVGANEMPDVTASQVALMILVRSNPDRRRLRAWTFWQDGHHFYVLHLGDTCTLVFDTLTRKWSEWRTQDFNIWRANYGINWNEDVVAGSVDTNVLFRVNPDSPTDLVAPIVSVITGGYPMRMRDSITCDEVMVTSSVGMSSNVNATLGLRTSDDYGITWQNWGTLALDTATPRTQVTWASLGEITAPGRIFELTDSGAAKRINSLELYSRDIQNG